MSLEFSLEKAYAAVVIAHETLLADVRFLYAHQTTAQEQTGEKEITNPPLPNIKLTANKREEMVPNSGIYAVELTVEVEDAAVREDGIGGNLDEIFTHAVRPLLYKPLPAMISAAGAIDSLKCFGLPERGTGSQISFGEGQVSQSQTATFICSAMV